MSKLIEIISIREEIPGRIECDVNFGNKPEVITFYFSENVHYAISADRIDSIVMGLLRFAIHYEYDFKSAIPITEELKYRLDHHYINGICSEHDLYRPKIDAPVISECAKCTPQIIATGISCGVDSLYSVMDHTENVTDGNRLTNLVFLNAGAHHFGSEQLQKTLYEGRQQFCRKFCEEIGLPMIDISTNLPQIIDHFTQYSHVANHTYIMLSCMLWLQKGLSKYYYSGGYSYSKSHLSIQDKETASAKFDLFTLWTASFGNISFYSTGSDLSRLQKVEKLTAYRPSYNHLNVCVQSVKNCGECFKCRRTQLELDSLGALNKYAGVFDLERYNKNRKIYLIEAYYDFLKGDAHFNSIMTFLKANTKPSERTKQKIRKALHNIKKCTKSLLK